MTGLADVRLSASVCAFGILGLVSYAFMVTCFQLWSWIIAMLLLLKQYHAKSTDGIHHAGQRKGIVLILTMILLVAFASLAVSMATMSDMSLQIASNHTNANSARYAAESGLECAEYILRTVSLEETASNTISEAQADQVWSDLQAHLQTVQLGNENVSVSYRFLDTYGSGDKVTVEGVSLGQGNATFDLSFYRYDGESSGIKISSTGINGGIQFKVGMDTDLAKESDVLKYAIASRGRMWVTGDTTIHGDVYSSWDRPEIACFDMTSDTSVLGTINTILARDDIENAGYELETLNDEGEAVDWSGNTIGDNFEDRYADGDDKIQGYHEGVNYENPTDNMPGMDISDYDTDMYNQDLFTLPSCPESDREIEYFPHASGNYNQPRDGTTRRTSNRKLTRHVYEDENFVDVRLADNRNALFRNCTFNGVLYIDCYKSASSYYNNVRFEDCTFQGVIVTDVPQSFKWMYNCLYFTGSASFNNQSDVQEATILAPHFNVNLGNTNPVEGENNVLTGAIVGGIVDVRGNAQIDGTIISMCDTTQWSSGYVTNIGATLDDGGSETTELGDIGTIEITPEVDNMLPSGITSPIVFKPNKSTYKEIL